MRHVGKMTKRLWVVGLVLAGMAQLGTAAVLTVGQNGANYASFSAAVNAVSQANSTIRFIDNGTYNETGPLSLNAAKYQGLTIESAVGYRATVRFTGNGGYCIYVGYYDNITLRNLNLVSQRGGPVVTWYGNYGTITDVNFVSSTVSGNNLLETGNHMTISYCTFRGAGVNSNSGDGISWTSDTIITVNHCSFDQLRIPIFNPWNTTTTTATVTNCAFGAWYAAGWAYGITINGPTATAIEDYNASYGPTIFAQPTKVTKGGHSLRPGSYAGIFTGNTGTGDWTIGSALYHAGGDGKNIGAWQGQFPMVNVQDYGAVGNGTTDDTVAIQAALNTGFSVYFPRTSSFYKVSNTLTYSGHRIFSDGATIKATNITFGIMYISNIDGLYVGDLTLEYPNEQQMTTANSPLQLFGCSDFLVERVIGKKGGFIYIYNCDNGTVRDSQMLTSSYDAFFIRSSNQILIENCYSEKSVDAFSTEDSTYITLRNNTAKDAHAGLRIEDSANVLAEGNLLLYCTSGAYAYGPKSSSAIFTTDITFRGNTFYRCYKTVSVNNDPYVANVCEFALSSKMNVGNVLFDNNIIIGKDESTLLTDLSSNVVFNTSLPLDARYVATDTSGTSYYTQVPYAKYAFIIKNDTIMPVDWLFYINFPSGVNLSNERVMTMDFYGGNDNLWAPTMSVSLYSGQNRTGFICEIPMYNPYDMICLPCILYILDGVDVSSVKCIAVNYTSATYGTNVVAISEIRKGLKAKVGYLHSYYHSEPADGVLNAVLDSNVFVNVTFPYVDRKRIVAYPATIIEGTGKTGTTAQRPTTPELGWHYYDTTISSPIWWDGSNWIDINTYWPGNKVSTAIHFDGSNFVELGNDDRILLNNYTIEGWLKPTTSGIANRNIIERCNISAPNGYLMQLSSANSLCAYQSVSWNFNAAKVESPFPHDNAFHHVAMTFSYTGGISTLKLYIDGVLVDIGSASGTPNYPLSSTAIKCGNGFAGVIGNIQFYTRAFSPAEIQTCYDRFKTQAGTTFSGTITLGDYSANLATVTATLEIVNMAGVTEEFFDNVTLDATGHYSVTAYSRSGGTYDLYAKTSHWLRKKVGEVTLGSSPVNFICLLNGDCDGDNQITSTDMSIVLENMGSSTSGSADLNGDGSVTTSDLSIVLANMDWIGN